MDVDNDFDGTTYIWPGAPTLGGLILVGDKACTFADYGWAGAAQKFIAIDLSAGNSVTHEDLSSNFTDYQSKVSFGNQPDYIGNNYLCCVYRFASEAAGETGMWKYDIDTDTFSYNDLSNKGYNCRFVTDSDIIYWASTSGASQTHPDYSKFGSSATIIDVGTSTPSAHLDNLDEIIWAFDFTAMAIYGYDDDTGTPAYTIDLTGTAVDNIPATGTITSRLSLITGEFFLYVRREVDPGDYCYLYCFIIKRG